MERVRHRHIRQRRSQLGALLRLERLLELLRVGDAGEEVHLPWHRALGQRVGAVGPLAPAHVPLVLGRLRLLGGAGGGWRW